MISGDHPTMALAIAREAEISTDAAREAAELALGMRA